MRLRLKLASCVRLFIQAAVFATVINAPAWAETSPLGRWLTESRDGVIEIAPCGARICGRIVGMMKATGPDGAPARDHAGQPKCNLVILDQSELLPTGEWQAKITNPDDGKVWNCVFAVAADGTLHLRGYVLVKLLGETQVWTRYVGRIGPNCAMS